MVPVVCSWPSAQARDLFDRSTVSGVVFAGPVLASNNEAWTSGGLGKLEHRGADFAADAVVAWRPDITDQVSSHISLAFQSSVRGVVGIDEAYVRLQRDPAAPIGVSARAGLFFPPASLEHDGAEWTTHYTLTPSAIGSWIAEEVKVLGTEVTLHTGIADRPASLTVAAFVANDTAGALLTFRGWALHDLRATAGQTLPLPPVTPVFFEQASRTRPVVEVDGRVGGYAKAEIAMSDVLSLSAMVYANNGNPAALRNGQYAWKTRFVTLGANLRTAGDTTVLAQVLLGRTVMGLDADRRLVTDVSFRSAYLLVSKPLRAGSLTGRIDAFAVDDHSFLDLEDNRERGGAVTGAWTTPLSGATEVVTEVLAVWSDRTARARAGVRADQADVQTKIAIRTRF
ncbi:MAG: hypothetical protein ACKVOL_12865 [Novosphingobium sp.]